MRPSRSMVATMLMLGAIGSAAGPAAAATPTLAGIEDEVMCTVCGVPLSMAREAPAAKRQRALIAGLIAQGKSKEQIKEILVASYGPGVLAVPAKKGFDLIAWLVPIAALIAGLLLLIVLTLVWRGRRPEKTDRSTNPVPKLDPEDAARVEAALAEDR